MPYSKNPIRICRKCSSEFHCKNNSFYCEKCRTIKKNCAVCGIPFTTRPSLPKEIMTCGRKCGVIYQYRDVAKKRAERRGPCTNCGKPITRLNMNYGKRKPKNNFCSAKCHGEWNSQNRTADFHPRFKGGYKEYYGGSWRRQRRLARERDKICQRCGKTPEENGKALDVHHKIPFREFGVERSREANVLENLISYCASCHQYVEWETLNK